MPETSAGVQHSGPEDAGSVKVTGWPTYHILSLSGSSLGLSLLSSLVSSVTVFRLAVAKNQELSVIGGWVAGATGGSY